MSARLHFGVTLGAYPDGLPQFDWWRRFAEQAKTPGFDSRWAGERSCRPQAEILEQMERVAREVLPLGRR